MSAHARPSQPAAAPTPLRSGRALSASATCALGAVAAHAAAGGGTPGPLGVLLVAVVAAVLCVPLSRARLDAPGLTGVVLATQAVLHLGIGGGAHQMHASMLLAHAVAGAATVAVALGAERAWWRVLRRLWTPRPPVVGAVPAPARAAAVAPTAIRPAAGVRRTESARGPPASRGVPTPTVLLRLA